MKRGETVQSRTRRVGGRTDCVEDKLARLGDDVLTARFVISIEPPDLHQANPGKSTARLTWFAILANRLWEPGIGCVDEQLRPGLYAGGTNA
jgi:hypothetical protein